MRNQTAFQTVDMNIVDLKLFRCLVWSIQSCLRIRYLCIAFSRFAKRVFIYRGAFVPSLFLRRIIKTRFAIFNKVSFAVSSNLVCIAILFKIVKLIFLHRLRVCNAICVEYSVVYRVVVSSILRVL